MTFFRRVCTLFVLVGLAAVPTPVEAGGSLNPVSGLSASSVTILPGRPKPYAVAGSSAGTQLSALSPELIALGFDVPGAADFSAISFSFDEAGTAQIETQNIKALGNLVFGLKGAARSARFEIVDATGRKDSLALKNIAASEKFWRIAATDVSNSLDKTRIKALSFVVTQSDTSSSQRAGTLEIRARGLNLDNPASPVVIAPSAANQAAVSVSGTKDANAAVYINGAQAVAANASTSWAAQLPLQAEGPHSFQATARDSLGKTSAAANFNVLRDTVAPSAGVSVEASGDPTRGQSYRDVRLNLTAADAASGIDAMRFSTDGGSSWTGWTAYAAAQDVRLGEGWGNSQIIFEVRDKAGNARSAAADVKVAAADYLKDVGYQYFSATNAVEPTHGYPFEGFRQRGFTQPTNFGFFALVLADVIAGANVTDHLSRDQAVSWLETMMAHLVADQANPAIGALGLLPWMDFDAAAGDWKRGAGANGRQFMLGDNANLAASLAAAYGALLGPGVNEADPRIDAIKTKISAFLEKQRAGYKCLLDPGGLFRRGFQLRAGLPATQGIGACGDVGTSVAEFLGPAGEPDLEFQFGSEFRSVILFVALQYGADIPETVYTLQRSKVKKYEASAGAISTVAPYQGAFQMLWPVLTMPEILSGLAGPAEINPSMRRMLENYVDIQLDFSKARSLPGFLSASYDKGWLDLVRHSAEIVPFQFAAHHGTAYRRENMDLSGRTLEMKYTASAPVGAARFEFKQKNAGGGLDIVWQSSPFSLVAGDGAFSLTLPALTGMANIDETVLITYDTALEPAFRFSTRQLLFPGTQILTGYNARAGIRSIALDPECCDETPASLYTLGAARMIRPAQVDALLEDILRRYQNTLVSSHGVWEGIATQLPAESQLIDEQVLGNVASFILGLTGKGPESMTRYLKSRASAVKPGATLYDELDALWSPSAPRVDLFANSAAILNFTYNGLNGTSYRQSAPVNTSRRKLRIAYHAAAALENVTVEFKQQGNPEALHTLTLTLAPTGGAVREVVIDLAGEPDFWIGFINEFNLLMPQAQGTPQGALDGLWIE